ncbi:hypothetical protein FNF28_06634 [Cafeteria roenbergensis]|uniref:CCDC113/CCDC96 coiled-coil domain-containing protein n=1 Tax=Cafeteria roenbergensis TaxID=33653 RepID=A0A5A8CTW4_CAFRO|nr:hypothetical protein FNF28_06634 [Cafeteria roenbergensis]
MAGATAADDNWELSSELTAAVGRALEHEGRVQLSASAALQSLAQARAIELASEAPAAPASLAWYSARGCERAVREIFLLSSESEGGLGARLPQGASTLILPPSLWQQLVSLGSAGAAIGDEDAEALSSELAVLLEPARASLDGGLVGAGAWLPLAGEAGDEVLLIAIAGPASAEPVEALVCSAPDSQEACEPSNCMRDAEETRVSFRARAGASLVAVGFDAEGMPTVALPAAPDEAGYSVVLPPGLALAVVCEVQGGLPSGLEEASGDSLLDVLAAVWGGAVGVALGRGLSAGWLGGAFAAAEAAAAVRRAGSDMLTDEEAAREVMAAFDAGATAAHPEDGAGGNPAAEADARLEHGADGAARGPADGGGEQDAAGGDSPGTLASGEAAGPQPGGEEEEEAAAAADGMDGHGGHGELDGQASPVAAGGLVGPSDAETDADAEFGRRDASGWGDRHAMPSSGDEQRLMEAEAAAEATAALEAERQDLEDRLAEAVSDHEALSEDNRALQRRALLFFLEKNEGAGRAAGGAAAAAAASSADKEERYNELLAELRSANQKLALAEESFQAKAGRLHARLKGERERLDLVRTKLAEFQAEVCDKASHTVTGKGLPKTQAAQWEAEAATLREMVSGARQQFEYDSLRLGRLEQSARAREDVGGGLSTIDFEQLKIENATVHEKIEDRQDELRKLRSKMTTTVQVLTHVREKLQFVQAEADALHAKAAAVEAEVAAQRAALAGSKRQREKQRTLIDRRKTARGFAHSDRLAIDFETRKTEGAAMKQELEDLKRRYAAMQRRTKLATTTLERTRQDAAALGVADAVDLALG